MAKSWAIRFYRSKAWRVVREQALRRDAYTCHDCEGRATEVHHKNPITPENINDPNITLNIDNLESLCWPCHNKRTLGAGDVDEGYQFDEHGQVIKI